LAKSSTVSDKSVLIFVGIFTSQNRETFKLGDKYQLTVLVCPGNRKI
jgi:hypothetical protein